MQCRRFIIDNLFSQLNRYSHQSPTIFCSRVCSVNEMRLLTLALFGIFILFENYFTKKLRLANLGAFFNQIEAACSGDELRMNQVAGEFGKFSKKLKQLTVLTTNGLKGDDKKAAKNEAKAVTDELKRLGSSIQKDLKEDAKGKDGTKCIESTGGIAIAATALKDFAAQLSQDDGSQVSLSDAFNSAFQALVSASAAVDPRAAFTIAKDVCSTNSGMPICTDISNANSGLDLLDLMPSDITLGSDSDPDPDVEQCEQPMLIGPCEALMPSYFYNSATKACEEFNYGGCEGNDNRFDTREECVKTCGEDQTVDHDGACPPQQFMPDCQAPDQHACAMDSECADDEKCCHSMTSNCRECTKALDPTEKKGLCPKPIPGDEEFICDFFECSVDSMCSGDEKCCYNSCGSAVCAPPVAEPECAEGEEFTECGSPCESTCSLGDLFMACAAVCEIDVCRCAAGNVRTDAGKCVPRSQCTDEQMTKCPDNVPVNNCLESPCSSSKCGDDQAARCVDNFCDGCHAIWLDKENNVISSCLKLKAFSFKCLHCNHRCHAYLTIPPISVFAL